MRHIPVAYATEEDYVVCTIVSMLSVLETADSDTYYDFYILVDKDFTEESKGKILEILEAYKSRCSIMFKMVGQIFDNVCLRIDFIKKPTYFRLLLPRLLQEERCIYLDSDTVICTDLQKLFDMEMGETYLAGVKAPGYILHSSETSRKQALLPNMQQYINAGVLLMNLDQMRKDCVVEKFLRLIPLKMESQDQDIINSVCYDKITFLPFEFNVMIKYAAWKMEDYAEVFQAEELKKAWNDPSIIHYADRTKPWKNLNCIMGDFWWSTCRRSPIWNRFFKNESESLFFETLYSATCGINRITTKRTGALFDLKFKKELIIFGAGDRANSFIQYLKNYGMTPEYIMVSNKEGNPQVLAGIKVKELSDIGDSNVTKTVVIATLEKYHVEILLLLKKFKFKEIIPLSDKWNLTKL